MRSFEDWEPYHGYPPPDLHDSKEQEETMGIEVKPRRLRWEFESSSEGDGLKARCELYKESFYWRIHETTSGWSIARTDAELIGKDQITEFNSLRGAIEECEAGENAHWEQWLAFVSRQLCKGK